MENSAVLKFADRFLFFFHIALIAFNLFGWIVPRLRNWNLIALSLTAFSWFVLGIFYGFGYCFLTDWHWDIRDKLGYSNESNSYIHFLIAEITGLSLDETLVDIFTAVFFFTAVAMSIYVNVRDARKRRMT